MRSTHWSFSRFQSQTRTSALTIPTLLLATICIAVQATGCARTEPEIETTNIDLDEQTAEADASQFAARAEEMQRLFTAATQHESNDRWTEAAIVWSKVQEQAAALFGAESWQAKNANLAHQTALSRSDFDDEQRLLANHLATQQAAIQTLARNKRIPEAIRESAKLIEQARQLWGENSHNTANKIEGYAELLRAAGLDDKASSALQQVIRIRRQALGEVHPDYERAVFTLGSLYSQVDQPELALQRFRHCHEVALKLWGADATRTALIQNEIGVLLSRQGEFEEAADSIQAAAKIRLEQLGPQSAPYAQSMLNLGVIRCSQSEFEQAIPHLKAAEQAISGNESLQADSMLCIGVYSNLGTALLQTGDLAAAEKAYVSLVSTTKWSHGENHPVHAGGLFQLAIATGRLGNTEVAEALFRKSIEIQRQTLSPSHPDLVWSIQSYARMLEGSGRSEEAAEMLKLIPARSNVAEGTRKMKADFGGGTFTR